MKVYIYVLKHPETLEIRYVGLTRFPVKRLNNEINYPHTKHLRNWVNSLKQSGLKPLMEVVEESEEGALCDAAERKWIAEMKSRGCRLINYTDGGERGYKCSEEYLASLSAWQKGKKKGPLSEKHKKNISAALKGRELSPGNGKYFAALNVQRKGIPLKESTKEKLREIGKTRLKGEWLLRFIEGNRNRERPSKCTDEQKAEIKCLLAHGYSQKVLADRYGLTIVTISSVKRNQIWRNIIPADAVVDPPPYKTIPLFRNEKGQYKRAA